MTDSHLRADWMTPLESRLAPGHPHRAEILHLHAAACEHGEAGYVDPDSGWWVFTAAHLADQGGCCTRGCRHCPYPEDE